MSAYFIWDNHGCMPLRADDSFLPQLERYRNAGVSVVSVNVGYADVSWADHLKVLTFMRQWITEHSAKYRLIDSVEDIDRCKRDGKLGITFDIEGMKPVADDPWLVSAFYQLGVRWMLIAYNKNNKCGGGCMDDDTGLTPAGRHIIDEMQRVGMVLCLSHTGERTAMDAIEYSRSPVIFSHSNPSGENPHVRNISDAVMQRCAARGGIIGLSGIGPFVGASEVLFDRFLRQLRYAIDLVGPSHVGIGLDYVFDRRELETHIRDNPTLYPSDVAKGLDMIPPEQLSCVAEGLARCGFSDSDIRGVLGENWLRIARQVWR